MTMHGERGVARLSADHKTRTVLAKTYQGKRFSSPNDVTVGQNGDVFFTDPPYGLPNMEKDPAR